MVITAFLWFGTSEIYIHSLWMLHWHRGNSTPVPLPMKQPWRIWVNTVWIHYKLLNSLNKAKQNTAVHNLWDILYEKAACGKHTFIKETKMVTMMNESSIVNIRPKWRVMFLTISFYESFREKTSYWANGWRSYIKHVISKTNDHDPDSKVHGANME